MYHYAANNPVRYTDPNGRWIDNGDGTHTAEKGDTLWGLFGSDWQDKSGYAGDPTKLQVGDTVGFKNNINKGNDTILSSREIGEFAFARFGYALAEGVGINGSSFFKGSTIIEGNRIKIFASGKFIGENLVYRYHITGNAKLFINGEKIASSNFLYVRENSIYEGGYQMIGEAVFDGDFTNAKSISAKLNFTINFSTYSENYITYLPKEIKIK